MSQKESQVNAIFMLGTFPSKTSSTTGIQSNTEIAQDKILWDEFIPFNEFINLQTPFLVDKKDVLPLINLLSMEELDLELREKYILSAFLARIAISLLKNCVNKLSIIAIRNKKYVESSEEIDWKYVSIDEKYRIINKELLLKLKINASTSPLTIIQNQLLKLVELLQTAYKELQIEGTFKTFMSHVDTLLTIQREESLFKDEIQIKQSTLKDIKFLYKEQCNRINSEGQQLQIKYKTLVNDYETFNVMKREEIQYLTKWEEGRNQQNKLLRSKEEHVYTDVLNGIEKKTYLENTAFKSIVTYFKATQEDLLVDIEKWSNMYDINMEEMEIRISQRKVDLESISEELEGMDKLYEERMVDINNWLDFKRQTKAEEEYERNRIWAAIKIQSWWRMIMVRKRLGRYKKIFLQAKKNRRMLIKMLKAKKAEEAKKKKR